MSEREQALQDNAKPCDCGCARRQHYQWTGSCVGCNKCAAYREPVPMLRAPNQDELPSLFAIALREIADRLEQGRVLHPVAKAFVHRGPTITVLDDPNEFAQYEITVTIPIEALPHGEATYGP